MPKELARVVARSNVLQQQADKLSLELQGYELDYIQRRDNVFVASEELVKLLRMLGARTAADPQAANDPEVESWLDDIEKYKSLMADRHSAYLETAKKAKPIHAEVVKLEKDVAAVIKAKSGFFSTSKSLPQLKALAATLHQFGEDLQATISAEL